MATLLPFPARREQFWPSLGLHLRTTTAIWRHELAELSPFGAPEIGWRRSPAGMELVWPGVSEGSDRTVVTVSGHWQPLRDPQRAIVAILQEAELEYETLRPIEPWALAVQPRDVGLGLPPGRKIGRVAIVATVPPRSAGCVWRCALPASLLCLAGMHSADHLFPLRWLAYAQSLRRGIPIRPPIFWL